MPPSLCLSHRRFVFVISPLPPTRTPAINLPRPNGTTATPSLDGTPTRSCASPLVLRVEAATLPQQLAGGRIVPGEMVGPPRNDHFFAVDLNDLRRRVALVRLLVTFIFTKLSPLLLCRCRGRTRPDTSGWLARITARSTIPLALSTGLLHSHDRTTIHQNRRRTQIPPHGILAITFLQIGFPLLVAGHVEACQRSRLEIDNHMLAIGRGEGLLPLPLGCLPGRSFRASSATVPCPACRSRGGRPAPSIFHLPATESNCLRRLADRARHEDPIAPHGRRRGSLPRQINLPSDAFGAGKLHRVLASRRHARTLRPTPLRPVFGGQHRADRESNGRLKRMQRYRRSA